MIDRFYVHLVGLYYKNISRCTVLWMSNSKMHKPTEWNCRWLLSVRTTNSMPQNPYWGASRSWAVMKTGDSLPHWQQPSICPYPIHSNPAHVSVPHFLNIHCNIILPSTSRSSKWCLSLKLPTKALHAPLLPPIRATWPAYPIILDLIGRIIFG